MAFLLFFGVIILNIFCVIFHKQSKIIVGISVLILMLIFSYAGTESGDLRAYQNEYYNPLLIIDRYEIGWVFINGISLKFGLTFETFRTLIFIVFSVILCLSFKDWKFNIHIFVSLYSLYLFYFLSIALRNFMALSTIMLGISFLQRRKPIFYLACVIGAFLFHSSSIVFIVFLGVLLPDEYQWEEKVIRLICIIGLVFLAIMIVDVEAAQSVLNNALEPFNTLLESFLGGRSYARQYAQIRTYGLSSFVRTIDILIIFVNHHFIIQMEKRLSDSSIENTLKNEICILVKINRLSLVFIPLIAISQTPVRLFFPSIMIFIKLFSLTYNVMHIERVGIKLTGNIGATPGSFCFITYMIALVWFFAMYTLGAFGFNIVYFLETNKLL